jgi:LysM repeat protein
MKKLFLILFLLPFVVKAQEAPLMIAGIGDNLYLTHTAAAKENFYSIGRLYNISPKEIAPYNNLSMDKGLSIGQTVKIPLKAVNFSQTGTAAADEVVLPVYHEVQPKETLYQLSTHYNKVPVASVKSWNNLNGDAVSTGQNIIVGYLKVKKSLSAFAQSGTTVPVAMHEEAAKTILVKANPPAKKPEPKPVVIKEEPKEEQVVVQKEPVKKATPVQVVSTSTGAAEFKGGVFRTQYSNAGKDESGTAGIFKSTSGWDDGKYYCLHNTAAQGTILKITNTATGKSIYAKVLDGIPDLKQNNNLILRLSNAGADAIGANGNFECTINY